MELTESGLIVISNSVIKKWRTCRRMFHYAFNMDLEPRLKKIQLFRGSTLHQMLDYWKTGRDWMIPLNGAEEKLDEMFIEELEDVSEYKDFVKEVKRIFLGYLRRWKNHPIVFKDSEVLLKYEIIPGKVLFTGKVDALCEDRTTGGWWLGEHKTHKNFPSEETRFANAQTIIYKWLLQQCGYPEVEGVMWDYLRTKPARDPKVLKSGHLSRAQRTLASTDYYHFKRYLKQNGIPLADYEEELDFLQDQGDRYYQRIFLPINSRMVKNVVKDVMETAHEILEYHESSKARNLSEMTCRNCDFKTLCFAQLSGADAKFVRKRSYQKRSKEMSIDAVDRSEL